MVNKKNLYEDVDFLTKLNPARSYKNLSSLKIAAEYIKNEFGKVGLSAEYQFFNVGGNEYSNIIASYNTSKDKRFIVGAHYDVYDELPGADDNASAVAGLLETARLLAKDKPLLDYRIDLVAYCLEEPPFFRTKDMGSAVHAKYLYDNTIEVIGMLCYEMIGYFSDKPGSQDYPIPELYNFYPDKGNFIIIAGKEGQENFVEQIYNNFKANSEIEVFPIVNKHLDELLSLSDHLNYWEHGYNAVMINDTSFMRNPNYHLPSDTIDTLNFDKMAEVVKGCYYSIIGM